MIADSESPQILISTVTFSFHKYYNKAKHTKILTASQHLHPEKAYSYTQVCYTNKQTMPLSFSNLHRVQSKPHIPATLAHACIIKATYSCNHCTCLNHHNPEYPPLHPLPKPCLSRTSTAVTSYPAIQPQQFASASPVASQC